MAPKRSKPPAKPRRIDADPEKPRVIAVREIDPEVYRFLAEGRGSQGVRSWLPYFVRMEKLRRAISEEARKEPVTPFVSKLRQTLAAAGVLFPGSG